MYSTGHIDKKEVDQPKPTVVVGSVDEILSKPKPATGEHKAGCPATGGYGHGPEPCICGADKPTTGEWTVEKVKDREAHAILHYKMGSSAYLLHGDAEAISDAHNAALAAKDKENYEAYLHYEEQLAAEREKTRQEIMKVTRYDAANEQLRSQLAAVQAAIANHNHVWPNHQIKSDTAALAKVKEGK